MISNNCQKISNSLRMLSGVKVLHNCSLHSVDVKVYLRNVFVKYSIVNICSHFITPVPTSVQLGYSHIPMLKKYNKIPDQL